VKRISRRRHEGGLRKELRFWRKPNILESQDFRVKRYLPYIERAARECKTGRVENTLDVGCGPACLAQYVPNGKKWYLDPLIDSYRELFADRMPREGQWIASTVEDADLGENRFDVILSLNALDHVRDPWLALAKLCRALKPGGVFVLSLYTRGRLLAFLRNLQEALWVSTDRAHPYSFTDASARSALASAGFVIRSEEEIEKERDRAERIWLCSKES
jgi:SAM-dependent methyltransferase